MQQIMDTTMLKYNYENVFGLNVILLDPLLLGKHLDELSYNASTGELIISGALPEEVELLILSLTGELPTTKEIL